MKQAQALDILKTGRSVFLTGQAGAGKTYVLNQYIRYLRDKHIPTAVTASTGIAATHMNGMTIHSWAGIGIKDAFEDKDFRRIAKKEGLMERLKNVQVLIIDEVSMLHARQLDLVDEVLRHFRKSERPFGGVQVVFSGDFFQLPPIGKKDETAKDKFAFMSKAWIELANQKQGGNPAITICYLTEQYRQTDTPEDSAGGLSLNDILNQIRNQSVTQDAINLLSATRNNPLDLSRTRLYTHNARVDEINEEELFALGGDVREYNAHALGEPELVETLKKNVRAPESLTLKVGAKVMFVKNRPEHGFYNGTMGRVVGFSRVVDENGESEILPDVLMNDGGKLTVEYEQWSIDDEDGVAIASYNQIPLCLAWAITVHKSQGMTLDAAEVDLSHTFEKGQGYVALSRMKSLQGLKLLGLNQKSLLLDEFAQVANRRFLTLSDESESWLAGLSAQTLAELQADFVKRTAVDYGDGLAGNDKSAISILAKAVKNAKTGKAAPKAPAKPKDDSKGITLTLIQAGKSIEQVAQERLLSRSTIATHVDELVSAGKLSLTDIAHLLPSDDIIAQVESAKTKLLDSGELDADAIKLRPIYDELRETVSYDDIRLCLMALKAGALKAESPKAKTPKAGISKGKKAKSETPND